MNSPEQELSIEVGDRVDLCPHGATTRNHAKGTVVDTSPKTVLRNAVSVELDNPPHNCENPYTTGIGAINEVLGDSDG